MLLLYIFLFLFSPSHHFSICTYHTSSIIISLSEKRRSLWTRYRSHFLIECPGEQSCLATLSSNPSAESWSNFLQPLVRSHKKIRCCQTMPLCSYVLSAVQTADFCIHAWKRIGGGSGFWCFVCVSVKGLQLTFLFTRPCMSQPVLIRSEWCVSIAVWDFNNQWWAHWLGASLLAHSSMYCLAYYFF